LSKKKTKMKTLLRKSRQKKGLCRCGGNLDEKQFKSCSKCREYQRNRRYKHEDTAEKNGLCYLMGCNNPIDVNLKFVACEKCRTERIRRYQDRLIKNICVICEKPADTGKSCCPDHLAYKVKKQKESFIRKKKLKRCVSCGSKNLDRKTLRCAECNLKMRNRWEKVRKDRINQGLCPCGVNKHNKNNYYCARCLVKHNNYTRKSRKRTRKGLKALQDVKPLLKSITEIDKNYIYKNNN